MRGLALGIMILIGFSRNFLGVHTPQDVLTGLLTGTLVMFLIVLLMKWLDTNPNKDWIVVLIGCLLAVIVGIYAGVKSYPMDYVDGKLIVDGAKMAKDTHKAVGYIIGFLIGWILERRFIKFTTDLTMMQRVTRVIFGVFGYYVVGIIISSLFNDYIPGTAGVIASCFIRLFYVTFCFPWCTRYVDKTADVK